MFGRATIRLGIGPHSSCLYVCPGLLKQLWYSFVKFSERGLVIVVDNMTLGILHFD